jgi:ABC-type branched-subunit amino acid transport system substrate-binding protein
VTRSDQNGTPAERAGKGRPSSQRRRLVRLAIVGAVGVLLAACGSSTSGGTPGQGGSGKGTLTIAMVAAFSGSDSIDGIAEAAGCYPAVRLINQAGGVMGHQVKCAVVDTRGDPADAIPAVEQLLATTPGLAGVIGPESGTANALIPIITKAHIPLITNDGLANSDHSTNPYYWRNYPADDVGGVALALWAKKMGLLKGALFFDNSVNAQGSVPALLSTYQRLGGHVVSNLSVASDSTSYGTEMTQLLGTHPQVVFTETDPQTDATAFANMMTLGTPVPIYGTNATVIPQWLKAVAKVLGAANMEKYYRGVEPYAPPDAATKVFNSALLASAKQVSQPSQWLGQEYATAPYDAAITFCLAMDAAHSTSPSVLNSYILKVTAPGAGKTQVATYAQGVAALKAGKSIQYVGADGPTVFNRWHNSTGEFEIVQYLPNGQLKIVGLISAAELAHALGG